MRWTWMFLTLALAGCVSDSPTEPAELSLEISWSPQSPLTGQDVTFQVSAVSSVAGDKLESIVWQIDGTVMATQRPVVSFDSAGEHPVVVQVRSAKTGLNQAEGTVSVLMSAAQIQGQEPTPEPEPQPEPPAPTTEPGAPLQIVIDQEGPVVGFSYSWDETPDLVSWAFGDGASSSDHTPIHTYSEAGDYTVTLRASGEEGIEEVNTTVTIEALPMPPEPEWGDPDSKGLRPGINMVTEGAGCTTSFLVHHRWERLFLSTAAHCIEDGGSEETDGCLAPLRPLGTKSTLTLDTGGTVQVPSAFSSWRTMQDRGTTNGDLCGGNDFALLEIPAEHWDKAHPASLHFQAPTGLATSGTADLWGYGASGLKFGIEPSHPKQGRHLGTNNGGWSHLVYLGTPGIPGDSGGHIMTDDGQALGVASTVILTPYPAANHYTDFSKALDYAADAMELELELVTWDDFNPSLI